MTVLSIEYVWAYKTSGTISANFGDQKLEIKLTEAQAADFTRQALEIVQANQAALAKEIAEAQPELLPHYTDYEEF